jgi:transcriptional regulator with XRE-family HTH domain
MNERIKQIRTSYKLSRRAFGERIGISGDVVNNLERGRVEIKEPIIKLICDKYNINEDWLRTGNGGMFAQDKDSDMDLIYELLNDDSNELYGIIKNIMKTYVKLDKNSQDVIRNFSKSLLENMKGED